MSNFDVIIIGWGLGGLVSGAKLSKEGKKVLLIEQHYIPGWCATTFKRKGYIMEVWLHEIDGLDKNDLKIEVFNDLKIFDNVKFIKIPEFYRFTNKRFDIVIPNNMQKAVEILIKNFPKEKKWINKFFKKIYAINKEIKNLPLERWKIILLFPIFPLLYPNIVFNILKTLGNFLDSIIKNEDLKLILLANLSYYHDNPYSMSLIYYWIAQASFYNWWYYIKGGSQKLSNYLVKIIENNWSKVLLWNKVIQILTEGNKAIWIKYQKTLGKTSETKKIFANTIIANTSIPNVINLLPKKNQKILKIKTQKLEKSCSLITVYIGFKKEIKELNNESYSTFVFDENIKNQNDLIKNFKDDFEKRNFAFVDYSQIDSWLTPKGKSFGVVCTIDYLTDWNKLSKEEYRKKKEKVAQIFFKRLEELIPGISKEIDCYEVGTSKTIKRYTLNSEWAVYGFAQIPKQAWIFRVSNKSPIKNLYFASARTNPGGGFTWAILSGWFCAKKILSNTF